MVKTVEERFWAFVIKTPFCWVWRAPHPSGYGFLRVDGKKRAAHRWLFERTVCLVPQGFELDHLCRNRACVRPDHLEIVTRRENVLRGDAPSARAVRTNHCKRGHAFDEANTYIRSDGGRQCRTCDRLRWPEKKARKTARMAVKDEAGIR